MRRLWISLSSIIRDARSMLIDRRGRILFWNVSPERVGSDRTPGDGSAGEPRSRRFDGAPFMSVGRARRSSDVGGAIGDGELWQDDRQGWPLHRQRARRTAARGGPDEGAELANVEGGTLTGHWPRRVKPPAERTSPRKKGFLSSPVHVDAPRLYVVRRAHVHRASATVGLHRSARLASLAVYGWSRLQRPSQAMNSYGRTR